MAINERLTVTALFLRQNGHLLQTGNAELEPFTLRVVNGHPSLDEIADWFREYSIIEG